jgi:hypothetical protein
VTKTVTGMTAPTLAHLRAAAARFAAFGDVDRSWERLLAVTAPAIDLARADHRDAALTWLNSWACRIPRGPLFGEGVARWWSSVELPAASSLLTLTDDDTAAIGHAYAALADVPVGRRRIAPTASGKLLYALRPGGIMPWDAAIAARLHGARDGDAFAAHQRLGRTWARDLVDEAGVAEDELPQLIGRPSVSLAKILDEYTYLVANGHMRG